jgi:hypothetical protein
MPRLVEAKARKADARAAFGRAIVNACQTEKANGGEEEGDQPPLQYSPDGH